MIITTVILNAVLVAGCGQSARYLPEVGVLSIKGEAAVSALRGAVVSLVLSLCEWSPLRPFDDLAWVGGANYARLAEDPTFGTSLARRTSATRSPARCAA